MLNKMVLNHNAYKEFVAMIDDKLKDIEFATDEGFEEIQLMFEAPNLKTWDVEDLEWLFNQTYLLNYLNEIPPFWVLVDRYDILTFDEKVEIGLKVREIARIFNQEQ